MLKLGRDINLKPLKCVHKEGSEKLRDLHYKINAVLYLASGKFIDQKLANTLYTDLCALGVELDELDVPETARPKKIELLGKLREVCLSLKTYRKQPQTAADAENMQKAINWYIANYIKSKKEDSFTPAVALEFLKESRRLYDAFLPFSGVLKFEYLIKANGELLRYFESKYSILEID